MLFCPNIHLKLPTALLVYRIIDSHVKRYLVSCVNCKDSDQAAKTRYPIRAFSVFIPGRNTLCTSSSWESMLHQEKAHSIKSRFHCRQGKQTKSHKSPLSLCKISVNGGLTLHLRSYIFIFNQIFVIITMKRYRITLTNNKDIHHKLSCTLAQIDQNCPVYS